MPESPPPIAELIRRGGFGLTPEQTPELAERLKEARETFVRLRLHYQFGIEEILTKINILRQEFEATHAYSPIEHVRSRLKSPESLIDKVARTGCGPDEDAIRARVRDIAGIRITCSFLPDVYWIAQMLCQQPDVTLVEKRDYIAHPKPNGYQSLHLIVQVPVFLSDRTENIVVEIQIRTIAMDFWASVEHKLFYKYDRELPPHLVAVLDDAARVATELDQRMARLREEIQELDVTASSRPTGEAAAAVNSRRRSGDPGGCDKT